MRSTYIVDIHVLVIACILVLDIRRDNELMTSRDRNLNGSHNLSYSVDRGLRGLRLDHSA
jgi:hypothetical protein